MVSDNASMPQFISIRFHINATNSVCLLWRKLAAYRGKVWPHRLYDWHIMTLYILELVRIGNKAMYMRPYVRLYSHALVIVLQKEICVVDATQLTLQVNVL